MYLAGGDKTVCAVVAGAHGIARTCERELGRKPDCGVVFYEQYCLHGYKYDASARVFIGAEPQV